MSNDPSKQISVSFNGISATTSQDPTADREKTALFAQFMTDDKTTAVPVRMLPLDFSTRRSGEPQGGFCFMLPEGGRVCIAARECGDRLELFCMAPKDSKLPASFSVSFHQKVPIVEGIWRSMESENGCWSSCGTITGGKFTAGRSVSLEFCTTAFGQPVRITSLPMDLIRTPGLFYLVVPNHISGGTLPPVSESEEGR